MGVDWYNGALQAIDRDAQRALEMTADALKQDLIQSHTLPFAENSEANRRRGVVPGELQMSVYVDRTRSERGTVSVVTSTPYARRLYYHPEYDFYRGENKLAGGKWYEPYRAGKKLAWLRKAYAEFLRRSRAW